MKLTYKSVFSHLRIATAVTLMSAALAMAFVAATNNVLTAGNSSSKSPTRAPFFGKLSAQDLAGALGEPGDGRHGDNVTPNDSEQDAFAAAAQDYLHRAYPPADGAIRDTLDAQSAWSKINA